MIHTVDITKVKDMVHRLDPDAQQDEASTAFRAAVVVLAASRIGPVVDDLAATTGYEKEFVSKIALRMRLAGLWSNISAKCNHWLNDDGDTILPVVFWADVLVAEGWVMAQPEGPRMRYWALPTAQHID